MSCMKKISLEAQVLLKHKEMFIKISPAENSRKDCFDIPANLLKCGLISETQAKNISSTVVDADNSEDKSEQNRQLFDVIVSVVKSTNFIQLCSVLNCVERYNGLVQSMVHYYCTCLIIIDSSTCDDTQLDVLIKALKEQNLLTEADCKNICEEANKRNCLLNTLHSNQKICYSFLDTLQKIKPEELQVEIYGKIGKIYNEINQMEDCIFCNKISAIIAITSAAVATSDTITTAISSATITTTTCTSTITTTGVTDAINTACSITTITTTATIIATATTTSTAAAISDVLSDYQKLLKGSHNNLQEVSTQGWFDSSVQCKQFINVYVTLIKSLEKDYSVEKYYTTTEQMIEDEVVYGTRQYVHYDQIFEVDFHTFQLFLVEGNAGTGKTTLAYRVCKRWANGEVLKQYSCIILVELRKLEPDTEICLKTLLASNGQSVSDDVCSELSKIQGNGILIWLEGWDELDNKLIQNSSFDNLLHGKMLPQAHIVISTRPSATRTLKKFNFMHKFKLIGFIQKQIKEYVSCYFADHPQAEKFMDHLNTTPGLVDLARVPLYLATIARLFKEDKQLPGKLTGIYSSFLTICLQHHKEKNHGDSQPITNLNDDLPIEMRQIFQCLQKCAYEQFLYHSKLTEKEISQDFFNGSKVPNNFDGLGLFGIGNKTNAVGVLKYYYFQHKPIQEMLAALYLTRLEPSDLARELSEAFGNEGLEMVWVLYAGITNLQQIPIEKILEKHKMTPPQQPLISLPAKSLRDLVTAWKQCHTYYMDITGHFNMLFLLSLILCCYEAQNSDACRHIANHFYTDKVCRFEIPPNYATPYLLLAVSYFISHSGKVWSLRCNTFIPSSVKLLFEHMNKPSYHFTSVEVTGHLWVFCCVVKHSEIDTFCNAIKSQSSLQWIHLLPGSYLGDDGARKLCECFGFDSQVIKVEIDECSIGSQGLRHIGRLLKANRKILCVNMRKNNFALDDVKEFLLRFKTQRYLQSLLLDKTYCENPEILAILEEINLIRATSDNAPLMVTHR